MGKQPAAPSVMPRAAIDRLDCYAMMPPRGFHGGIHASGAVRLRRYDLAQPLIGFPPKQDPLQQAVQGSGVGTVSSRMQHPRPGRHSHWPTLQCRPTAALQLMHASPPVPQTSYSPITHVPNAQQPVAQVDFLQRLGFFGVFLATTRTTPDGPIINPTPRRPASSPRRLAPLRTAFAIASNCSASTDMLLSPPRPVCGSHSTYRESGPSGAKRYTAIMDRTPRVGSPPAWALARGARSCVCVTPNT
jgi:hypothetical protein